MDNYIRIIQELLSRTQARKISWEPTNYKDQFKVNVGTGSITFDYTDPESNYDEEIPIYEVDFFNSNGLEIARVEAHDGTSEHYQLLDHLWEAVQDSYYKKRETIDSMLEDLGLHNS